MSSHIQGVDALERRIRAVGDTAEQVQKDWGDEAVKALRSATPRRTGATQDSIQLDRFGPGANETRITGSPVVIFLDVGTKQHTVEGSGLLRWQGRDSIVFRKSATIPRQRGRHFRADAARKALEQVDMPAVCVSKWNGAA